MQLFGIHSPKDYVLPFGGPAKLRINVLLKTRKHAITCLWVEDKIFWELSILLCTAQHINGNIPHDRANLDVQKLLTPWTTSSQPELRIKGKSVPLFKWCANNRIFIKNIYHVMWPFIYQHLTKNNQKVRSICRKENWVLQWNPVVTILDI